MKVFVIALALLGVLAAASSPSRVIFLGDSITEGGAGPTGFITLLREELIKNAVADQYELIGKGIGGNMVRHLLARFENDVIDAKPDLVVICVGVNDVGFFQWHPETGGTPPDQYEAGLRYMVKRLRQKNINVVLCSPLLIEERWDGTNPLDKQLDRYTSICRKVAKQEGADFCDLRKNLLDYLRLHNKENAPKGVLTNDYVHLNEQGNSIIARSLLPYILDEK